MKVICLIIIISLPFVRLGDGLSKIKKEDNNPSEFIASLIVFALSMVVYYYAGIFELLKESW